MTTIPRIDPNVRVVTIGQMRKLDLATLKDQTVIVHDGGELVAVLLAYGAFLLMQDERDSLARRVAELEQRNTPSLLDLDALPVGGK